MRKAISVVDRNGIMMKNSSMGVGDFFQNL